MTSDATGLLDRRTLLAAGGGAALGSLAGCGASLPGFGDDSEPTYPTLTFITLTNEHPEPHRFDLLIERGGEIVHWQGYDVEAWDPDGKVLGQVIVEPPAFESEPADWRVAATVDSKSTGVAIRLAEVTVSEGCYPVNFFLRENEELMATSSATSRCEPGTTTDGE